MCPCKILVQWNFTLGNQKTFVKLCVYNNQKFYGNDMIQDKHLIVLFFKIITLEFLIKTIQYPKDGQLYMRLTYVNPF